MLSKPTRTLCTAIVLLVVFTCPAGAVGEGDWPRFRGPGGAGSSDAEVLPVTWNPTENIAWTTELPGPGASSPIVVAERIFLTCYSGFGTGVRDRSGVGDLERHVLCISAADGRVLWRRRVPNTLPANSRPGRAIRIGGVPAVVHGYASSTPASDGQRLYCFFGNSGVYAFSMDGKPAWHTRVGERTHKWGSAASPVLHGGLVIVNASVEGDKLVALRKESGEVAWEAGGIKDSWNTPALVDVGGRTELVVGMRETTLGLDPATGATLWRAGKGWQGYVCPSIVAGAGAIYSLGGNMAMAIRPGGQGDVTATHRVWTAWKGSNVSSPVCHDGHLYWASGKRGIAYCLNVRSGKVVYAERLEPQPGDVYASPVVADGKIYYVSRRNGTFVVAARPQFKLLAHNVISTDTSIFNASPAVLDGRLLLRSNRRLYCIGKKR